MTVTVPSQYQSLVQAAAQGTGLPYQVVAAQANEESGFNATAVSPTGAEGWLQFEPDTYDSVAAQAGVSPGSEFNPADEEKAYVVFMTQLLHEEGGSVFKALEAYNAGPGNLPAGAGYANTILANAGSGTNIKASGGSGGGSNAQLTGLNVNPFDLFGIPSSIEGSAEKDVGTMLEDLGEGFLKSIGVASVKDLLIRAGLIIMGAVIIIVGLREFISSGGKAVEYGQAAQKSSSLKDFALAAEV
jgi:Transglycosylase SLT domain